MSVYMWNTFCPTLFGTGASGETGERAKALGMHRVMVCTEQALCEFGVVTPVIDALKDAGLEVFVFDRCRADAPSDICDAGAAYVREHAIDGVVAVGGGSTLDTAKAVGIVISQNGTTIRDYYGIGEAEHTLKLITLSTTSGTGSELSQWAVIGDVETGAKEMPVYKPDLAIVDPALTYSVPAGVTAATGMDVLAHCVEAITNRNYNPYGYIFGKEGIRLTLQWLPVAVKEPKNAQAREAMSLAASLGGMAISACGCRSDTASARRSARAIMCRTDWAARGGCRASWSIPPNMVSAGIWRKSPRQWGLPALRKPEPWSLRRRWRSAWLG